MSEKVIDSTIINVICNAEIDKNIKDKILSKYIDDCRNSFNGNKTDDKLKIVYDQDEISKTNIFKRLFRREMNQEEKFELLNRARRKERYGLATLEGEYKPDIISRTIGRLFGKKEKSFLTIDQMHEVANVYDILRDNGETEKISDKKWRDELHVSEEQLEELGQLNKEQKMQEKIKLGREQWKQRELELKMKREDPEIIKSKEEEYSKLVNNEYLRALDEDFDKAIQDNER